MVDVHRVQMPVTVCIFQNLLFGECLYSKIECTKYIFTFNLDRATRLINAAFMLDICGVDFHKLYVVVYGLDRVKKRSGEIIHQSFFLA